VTKHHFWSLWLDEETLETGPRRLKKAPETSKSGEGPERKKVKSSSFRAEETRSIVKKKEEIEENTTPVRDFHQKEGH